jgi:hypothetical protein
METKNTRERHARTSISPQAIADNFFVLFVTHANWQLAQDLQYPHSM